MTSARQSSVPSRTTTRLAMNAAARAPVQITVCDVTDGDGDGLMRTAPPLKSFPSNDLTRRLEPTAVKLL